MSAWFSRLFRSRTETLAERAEVEGRFDEAARLYVESGARDEAFRVLMRAAESARHLADRRGFITRAYGIAKDEPQRKLARRALGLVTLAEVETAPTQSDEERVRLAEAAADLEAAGAFREAARAYRLLNERDAVERMLMLAGDVEGYEREAGADAEEERYRLRRRNAIESFEALWRSGDRAGAVQGLEAWSREHADDGEARTLLDARRASLTASGRFEGVIDGVPHVVVGQFPATLGREAAVMLRGASVSREHAVVERDGAALTLRDNGSRNGTQLESLPLSGTVPLARGQGISLGADLLLRVRACDADAAVLEVERGMDRGRRVVLVCRAWGTGLGALRFDGDGRAVLEPGGPVRLSGQRVVAPITLARGDRVEGEGGSLEVLR